MRLWVNDQLLIDNWTDHLTTENSGAITLVAGQTYDLRLEYYNGPCCGAVAKLLWSSASQTKEVIPQSQLYLPYTTPPVPSDGLAAVSYDEASNHITTDGFAYDAAGNQVRALIPGGSGSQRFRYDAANRLVQVLVDNNITVFASYTYGDSNERLIAEEGGLRTYYVGEGGATIAEYIEGSNSTTPAWSKHYVYLGARLLATLTPNGSGAEVIQFHHPDRLGTRIVTDPQYGTYFEQQTLPFGTALNETPPPGATFGETNRRFTSYDRSPTTGLDYAVYDSQQGRFTQVDPIGMNAVSLTSPQTLNLYAYCANDPINRTDPSGLGFFSFLGKVFNVIGKILKVAAVVVAAFLIFVAFSLVGQPWAGGIIAKALIEAGLLLTYAFAPPKISAAVGILVGIFTLKPPIIFNLSETAGHGALHKLARVLGILIGISSINDFLQQQKPPPGPKPTPGPDPTGNHPDPCRSLSSDQMLAYMRKGLSAAHLNLGLDDNWKLLNPGNASLQDIANGLQSAGWKRFRTNINPAHWGGIHFEGEVSPGAWFHMIYYPAQKEVLGARQIFKSVDDWSKPPTGFEMHCERGMARPSSLWHGLDYLIEMTLESGIKLP